MQFRNDLTSCFWYHISCSTENLYGLQALGMTGTSYV
jgi:hypothetical protein